MKNINNEILTICINIDKNIQNFKDNRGFISQNILSQLRNLVEHTCLRICNPKDNIDITYEGLKKSVSDIKSKPKKSYRFLGHVHSLLEISASHYTLDENASERLMLKYYEFLIKIKSFLLNEYNLKILQNINRFPINLDNTTLAFYKKIAEKIEFSLIKKTNKDRFYIQKIKPFFVNSKVYYEVTFTKSHDKVSKFDRIIAFTELDITQNYAVELFLKEEYIEILGKKLPIVIIDSWRVSIRPCELNNFARIFGINIKLGIAHKEYQRLMGFLTETCLSFSNYVVMEQEYYNSVKSRVLESIEGRFFDVLDICRDILLKNEPGSNIISYLLYTMSNKVIKLQTHKEVNFKLSNLHLKWESIPFDQMPFTSSLFNHNPKIYNLFVCINHEKREHEFLGRLVQNNVEIKGKLFTSLEELEKFDEIEVLIKKYNDLIYKKTQSSRLIEVYKDKFICMKGYLENTIQIVEKLKKLSNEGFTNYSNFVNAFINQTTYTVDCEDKKNFLTQMFENSKVAMIYGAAGTGKSTLINHISHVFKEYKKIYLAQTNPAKDNLERKVDVPNTQFMTITKFLSNKNLNTECAVLFIDESSTVSNYDMLKVLNKAEGKYTLLVLVGDIFQIESIRFGNWFEISKDFLPKQTIFELTKPYRSKNNSMG
ncbi:AAA family ATPase [Francisella tularensis]|uniref:AAA family ATPase n=1 Tax=Francisella tularensis TaxID=263 RepID=UPI0008F6099A|nr:AAA family ATPase [Francisella tularensis]APA82703.1 RecD-like DNA helicase YrrC [Francisella tularensis subsp. novicida PA10-7858]